MFLLFRLEATTSRLEDVSGAWEKYLSSGTGAAPADPGSVNATSPSAPTTVPPSHSAPAAAPPAEVPQSVVAFDQLVIEEKVQPLVTLTKSLAIPPVIEQVNRTLSPFSDRSPNARLWTG